MKSELKKSYTPFKLRGLELRNRFIKTATFEGMTPGGRISNTLIDHHVSMAKGGVGMTTVAYGAVSPEGATNADQVILDESARDLLTHLSASVHKYGAAISMQLTHCGFFTKNKDIKPGKPLSASRIFNEYGALSGLPFSKEMTSDDMKRTAGRFASAAKLVKSCGFDAVEVHMGHGYLLSQFLSHFTNRRKDEYGGSIENRLRFPLEVIAAIRQEVGDDYPVLCKINLEDGFKKGLTIQEAMKVAKALEKAGVDALVMSGGFTSKTPFLLLRGDVPLKEMIKAEDTFAVKAAMALLGKVIIRKYEFEENFFLPLAKQMREAVNMPLVYIGGIMSSQGIAEVMGSGFELIALGRALIHDAEFLKKAEQNSEHISECNHCNICVAEMEESGIKCVL